ncbi:MAG: FAD:protein FMN transferase, partial [Acidobacteriota bacterium]|nr:FAD:protein FMN transferase [Acidobacteriota bacterium]
MLVGCLIALVVLPAAVAAGDDEAGSPVTRARYLMGTLLSAGAYGDPQAVAAALDAALERVAALDDVMTTYRPEGELARLNRRVALASEEGRIPFTARVSPDLFRALSGALSMAESTSGRFDPTVGPLVEVWGIRDGGRTASASEIERARSRTSFRHVSLDEDALAVTVRAAGAAFDLGGYGKGFALDEAARVLRGRGIDRALLNFGGQVLALEAP